MTVHLRVVGVTDALDHCIEAVVFVSGVFNDTRCAVWVRNSVGAWNYKDGLWCISKEIREDIKIQVNNALKEEAGFLVWKIIFTND